MEDNEDMELDFNPFDSTFENFEDFDTQDVESLAQELHFYEEKAEFLAGQGALEGFSLSRDSFAVQHGFFGDDVNHLDATLQAHKAALPSEADLHFADQSFRGFAELEKGKKQPEAGPSKSAEEQGVRRANSAGSLKRTLSEQAGFSGGSQQSEEAHSRTMPTYGGMAFGHEAPAVESEAFGRSANVLGQSANALGQSAKALGRHPDGDEGRPPGGNDLHRMAPLGEDSLLGSLIEARESEPPISFGNDSDPLFRFDTDSKPFDFGAALFGHLPNGTTSLPGLDSDSPQGLGGGREGGGNSLLEPGLLTNDDANEITKANMWVSSDGDDKPIGSLVSGHTSSSVLELHGIL